MQTKILKLVFAQWQGGDIASWFKDLKPSEAARGYVLGAQILDLMIKQINPNLDENTAIVSVDLDYKADENDKRISQDGIIDKDILKLQNDNALKILQDKKARKILVLGGDCAVSIAPFSYLAQIYKDEIALVWIDAHPDLGFKGDDFYQGYHAMALSAITGDEALQKEFSLPAFIKPQNSLLVGLCSDEAKHYDKRRQSLGIKAIWGENIAQNEKKALGEILDFIKHSKAKKIAIHLDLDVLNPNELYVAVGNTGILSIQNIINIVKLLDENAQIVGFTIAEHFPKTQLKLKELLQNLTFIKQD